MQQRGRKLLLFALNLVTLLMQIQYALADAYMNEVVICFKFSNFAYANTVVKKRINNKIKLLFALNLVTLLMQIQYKKSVDYEFDVVICFKFSNFAYANTVLRTLQSIWLALLFALNLVTLLMQIQFELNKLLIVNALQRCWKIKKQQKSSLLI